MSPGTQTNNIDSVLTENRVFECSDEFRSKAHIRSMEEYERLYQAAETDPETFWSGIASQLHWFKPWDKVLDWNCPWSKWFSGGELNLRLVYKADLFAESTVVRMCTHLRMLLEQLAADPGRPISSYSLQSESENLVLISDFNE